MRLLVLASNYLKLIFLYIFLQFRDIPISSGLGSSSAFTVGLLTALHTLKGDQIKKKRNC